MKQTKSRVYNVSWVSSFFVKPKFSEIFVFDSLIKTLEVLPNHKVLIKETFSKQFLGDFPHDALRNRMGCHS